MKSSAVIVVAAVALGAQDGPAVALLGLLLALAFLGAVHACR